MHLRDVLAAYAGLGLQHGRLGEGVLDLLMTPEQPAMCCVWPATGLARQIDSFFLQASRNMLPVGSCVLFAKYVQYQSVDRLMWLSELMLPPGCLPGFLEQLSLRCFQVSETPGGWATLVMHSQANSMSL